MTVREHDHDGQGARPESRTTTVRQRDHDGEGNPHT
jgi:hypothetical protein